MKPTFSPQAQVQQAIAILAATVGGGLASLNEIKRMIAAETMNQTKAGGNAVTETFDDSARKNMNKVIDRKSVV